MRTWQCHLNSISPHSANRKRESFILVRLPCQTAAHHSHSGILLAHRSAISTPRDAILSSRRPRLTSATTAPTPTTITPSTTHISFSQTTQLLVLRRTTQAFTPRHPTHQQLQSQPRLWPRSRTLTTPANLLTSRTPQIQRPNRRGREKARAAPLRRFAWHTLTIQIPIQIRLQIHLQLDHQAKLHDANAKEKGRPRTPPTRASALTA
jgi:hypothetical protein